MLNTLFSSVVLLLLTVLTAFEAHAQDKVRWGEFNPDIGNLAFYYGVEKGIYESYGIDIEIITFSGGPPKMAAAIAGDIDMGTIGPPGVIAISKGAPIRFVSSGWTSSIYFFLVADMDVQSIEGLAGKTIAINNFGSGYDIALRKILTSSGIDPDQDVSIVAVGSGPAAYAALLRGDVDAAVLKEHLVSLSEASGFGRNLASAWDYVGPFHQTSIFASTNFLSQKRDLVERVLAAYWKSQEVFLEEREAVLEFGVKFLKVDRDVLKSALDRFKGRYRVSGEIDRDEILGTIKILTELGRIEGDLSLDAVLYSINP